MKVGSKLYRQILCNPIGTYCASLVADLFVLCYEKDFVILSLFFIKLVLLSGQTLPQDTSMTYLILIIKKVS